MTIYFYSTRDEDGAFIIRFDECNACGLDAGHCNNYENNKDCL